MATIEKPRVETPKTGDEIVAAVTKLLPEIRAAQSTSDDLTRSAPHIEKLLRDAGAFKLMYPKEYGGAEGTARNYMDLITAIAKGDAGTAWGVSLNLSACWALGTFWPKNVVEEILSDPDATMAGVFTGRAMTSRHVEGGLHIDEGKWFFNSGVYHATWDILGVPYLRDDGEIEPGLAVLPMDQVNILDEWDTIGLRGSGSTNVSVTDVFVPDERILSLGAMVRGELTRNYDRPLARMAFQPLMVVLLTFPVLGAGLHMLEEFLEKLPSRSIRATPYTNAAEAPVVQMVLGEASAKIEGGRTILEKACDTLDEWSQKEEYMPTLERARVCRDCAFAERLIWEGVDLLSQASGGTFAYNSNILRRLWQDVKTGNNHPFISSLTNYEMYGRMLAGVNPPLIFV